MEEPHVTDANELSELAYYYPEPYWLANEGSWIKSLLLFFDGVAILLPDYMSGRELVADPSLAEPLTDRGLLKVLQPEWFVDEELSNRLAEGMVELIVGGAFDETAPDESASSNPTRSSSSVGSDTVNALRPPPSRRTRPGSSVSPRSSSRIPRRTVSCESPVARTTAANPPRPHERASAPAHKRR